MKLATTFLLFLFTLQSITAQVGIGTQTPAATLDVVGTPSVNESVDGIIAPRISRENLIAKTGYTAAQTGAIVYITDLSGTVNPATTNINQTGYYYYNGSLWVSMQSSGGGGSAFGDIKTGIQVVDHNGWVLLNGRLLTDLTTTQAAQATSLLGVTATNLPDATNTYMSQNGAALGSVSGSNTKALDRNQLPNATLRYSRINAVYTDGNSGRSSVGIPSSGLSVGALINRLVW